MPEEPVATLIDERPIRVPSETVPTVCMDMNDILYFECYSGISGDMAVAAMIDLGADTESLMRALDSLELDGFRTEISRRSRSGLDVCDFDVVLDHDNHDHDAEYLYGDHACHDHGHAHGHRGLKEIMGIIDRADMTDRARSISARILGILAEAEAKAHGVPVEDVHFHEVGAVDSVVDIVSLGVCLDSLDVSEVCFSDLYEGTGTVRCQHGILPVPVPAVSNIVSAYSVPMRITDSKGEYVTPTGAAFAAAVRTCDRPGSFSIERIGMGAGKRESERSGILRAMILSPRSEEADTVVKLECNIDDSTGETLAYAAGRLMSEGAKDAFYTPIFMKKGRPAWMLSVICDEADRPRMESVILSETSTAGIRRCAMDRTVMRRRIETMDTPLGTIRVKILEADGTAKYHPEYDDLAAACTDAGIPFREGYDTVMSFLNRRG